MNSSIRLTLLFLLCALTLSPPTSFGQTVTAIDMVGSSTSIPNKHLTFSPSITSHGTQYTAPMVFSAFTYITSDGLHRSVAVSESTDAGASWSVIKVFDAGAGLRPKWGGTSSGLELKNVDDPQIISNGSTLVLVVRAWGDVPGGNDSTDWWFMGADGNGLGTKEQPGSIYLKSGIYVCTSTNNGSTWGYWRNGTWTSGAWGVVGENQNWSQSFTGHDPATLENPRVAWRNDYSAPNGYIVWGEKVWSNGTTVFHVIGGNNTAHTQIGIRAFDGDGKLFDIGSNSPYSTFSSCSISHLSLPERPSVAIAPDNTPWVSFYTLEYGSSSDGVNKPKMHVWYVNGSLNTSTHLVTYPNCPTELLSGIDKFAYGIYDVNRGYCYAGFDPDKDFDVDLAQGPSIQTAMESHSSPSAACGPPYHLGIVYSGSTSSESTPPSSTRAFNYANHLSFNSATVYGGVVTWRVSNDDLRSALSSTFSTDGNVHLFPSLKYTVAAKKNFDERFPAEDGLFFEQTSFFTVAYFAISQSYKTGTDDGRHIGEDRAQGGVSFDNEHFFVNKFNNNGTVNSTVGNNMGAESQTWQNGFVDPQNNSDENWGDQMDVCGNSYDGLFDVHLASRDIISTSVAGNARVEATNGDCILLRALLLGQAPGDSLAFPKGPIMHSNSDGTGVFPWGDFAWFSFDPGSRPSALSAKSSIVWQGATLQLRSSGIAPTLGSTIGNGIYYAPYTDQSSNTAKVSLGLLGNSNQRKMVCTGNYDHVVYEKGGRVWYSEQDNSPSYNWGMLTWGQDFTAAMPLEPAQSGIVSLRPSIAVYQQKSSLVSSLWNGPAAIAITWIDSTVSGSNFIYTIKMITREFNTCTGEWAPWSPSYTIDTHTTKSANLRNSITTPVIAPLLSQSGTGNTVTTTLLGWNIVWSAPMYGVVPPAPVQSVILERFWKRVSNSPWGTYPSSPTLVPLISSAPTTLVTAGPGSVMNPINFPTVTNMENKTDNSGNLEQISFSTDGTKNGIFQVTVTYNTAVSSMGTVQGVTPPVTISSAQPAAGSTISTFMDRKPDITVNSSGQAFVAWEHLERVSTPTKMLSQLSAIAVRNSKVGGSWAGAPAVLNLFPMNINALTFNFLLNPSITGYPKTLAGQTRTIQDQDPGAVEIVFWNNNGGLPNPILKDAAFQEQRGAAPGTGAWLAAQPASFPKNAIATNSQRDFGMYLTGPTFSNLFTGTGSLATGNTSNTQFLMPFAETDAFKGTFDSVLDVNLYRTEIHYTDSAEAVHFTWGDVYVGDTSMTLPMRQVVLHTGVDTAGYYQTQLEARDSLLCTDIFDWPVGATVRYWRGFLFSDSALSILSNPYVGMMYRIELVHIDDGTIDTLEQIMFNPHLGYLPEPGMMTVTNMNINARDVYLRVKLSATSGIQMDDSMATFRLESFDGMYPIDSNYFISAYKIGLPATRPIEGELSVSSPYPNPIAAGGVARSFVAYPEGRSVEISIIDPLGREVGLPQIIQTTGTWQPIELRLPRTDGNYYVIVRAAGESKQIPVTVTQSR